MRKVIAAHSQILRPAYARMKLLDIFPRRALQNAMLRQKHAKRKEEQRKEEQRKEEKRREKNC